MELRLIPNFLILVFLLSLTRFWCVSGSSWTKSEVRLLANYSRTYTKNFVKKFQNKTIELNGLIAKSVIIPGAWEAYSKMFAKHVGHYPIKNSFGARMFFYFFESTGSKDDPLIIWLTGGPGVGTLPHVFSGIGPLHITRDWKIKSNTFGLNKAAHMLFIDQPIGAGFSNSADDRDIRKWTNQTASDLYDFLQAFFEGHPQFKKNDLYILGDSYSGTTIPVLASQLHKENKVNKGIHINLKGFAITNGRTNPMYSYSFRLHFAYLNKLIKSREWKYWRGKNDKCLKSIKACQMDDNTCARGADICDDLFFKMFRNIKDIYSFRKIVSPPFIATAVSLKVEFLLEITSLKSAIGVGDYDYNFFNPVVFDAMRGDSMKNYEVGIPTLLDDGIKVLLFDGEYDLVCPWLANLRLLESLKWRDQKKISNRKLIAYKLNGKKVGEGKHVGPLTFVKVHKAGHGVILHQPKVAQQLLLNWIKE